MSGGYIRLVNYMGDFDDLHEINLIGPFPTRAARAAEPASVRGRGGGGRRCAPVVGGYRASVVAAGEAAQVMDRRAGRAYGGRHKPGRGAGRAHAVAELAPPVRLRR